MTIIVAITGGIGSGKTTLSDYLKKTGFLVHESDEVVSDMYTKPSKSFISFIMTARPPPREGPSPPKKHELGRSLFESFLS